MVISLILGAFIGAILGLTGAGGGILAVPALVAGMGWTMQQAAPVALIAVAGSAATGAVEGFRKKLVRYKAASLMATTGIVMTPMGQMLAHHLSQRWLTGLFALVMLLVAIRLLLQTRGTTTALNVVPPRACQLEAVSGKFHWTMRTGLLLGGTGAVTGLLTGLLGVGGGFVIVPLLRRLTPLSMHSVVATSLMVIALVGAGGVISASIRGVAFPVAITLLFVTTTALGMLGGRALAAQLPTRRIQQAFAIILLLVAASMLSHAFVMPG